MQNRLKDWQATHLGEPYLYSYTALHIANAYGRTGGVTSRFQPDRPRQAFKESQIRRASEKLMMVEGNGEPKLTLGPRSIHMIPQVNDGGFHPAGSLLSSHHSIRNMEGISEDVWKEKGRSIAAFCDGHVEMIAPKVGMDITRIDPTWDDPPRIYLNKQ